MKAEAAMWHVAQTTKGAVDRYDLRDRRSITQRDVLKAVGAEFRITRTHMGGTTP